MKDTTNVRRGSLVALAVLALVVSATAGSVAGLAVVDDGRPSVADGRPAANLAQSEGSALFQPNIVSQTRGDVLAITVRTTHAATVNLGSPETGFWLQVEVGKGRTVLELNTYEAAHNVERLSASEGRIRNQTLRTERPRGPLAATTYPMNVTIGGDEKAVGAFTIEPRRTNGLTALMAPNETDVAELETAADVRSAAFRPDGEAAVAHGDWLVLELNATGLGGFLAKEHLDGEEEGATLEFVQRGQGINTEPKRFTGDEAAKLIHDPEEGIAYLFVNTSEHGVEPVEIYEATFELGEDSPLVEEPESVSTTFSVVKRESELYYEGRTFVVGNATTTDGRTTVDGKTTLSPGSTVEVRARHEGLPPFLKTETVAVAGDRTFSATFDFGDVPEGTSFEIFSDDLGFHIPAVKPRPGASTPTPTATPTPTPTPTPTATPTPTPTPTATPAPTATPYPTERPITPQVAEAGGLFGFGIDVALVALFAASLLLWRRGR